MLLEVEAIRFMDDKPFIFTSGWASPVYIDCRKLISYPRIRSTLMDFLAVTGDLVQCALGSEWNRTTRAMVEAATGRPAATAMTAAVDALREVAATRVVVASPVSRGKLAAVREYLEAAGFAVTGTEGIDTASSHDIRSLPVSAPYDLATAAFRAHPGADAIYLPSLTWRATEYAARATSGRANSSAVRASARWCFTAWNEPIGAPN